MPNPPYVTYGTVTENGTPKVSLTVTIENVTLGGSDTCTTDSSGNYIYDDLATLPNGYGTGDTIKVSISADIFKTFITLSEPEEKQIDLPYYNESGKLVEIVLSATDTDIQSYSEASKLVELLETISKTELMGIDEIGKSISDPAVFQSNAFQVNAFQTERLISVVITELLSIGELNKLVENVLSISKTELLSIGELNKLVENVLSISKTELLSIGELTKLINITLTILETDIRVFKVEQIALNSTINQQIALNSTINQQIALNSIIELMEVSD